MHNAQFRDDNRILLTSRFLLRQIFPQQPDQIPAVSRLRSADHFFTRYLMVLTVTKQLSEMLS